MKKICYVCSTLSTKNSSGSYCIELIKHLKNKYDFYALCGDYEKNIPATIYKRPHISKTDNPNTPHRPHYSNGLLNTVYLPKIKKEYGIDLVHSQFLGALNKDLVTMHGCYKAWIKNINKLNNYFKLDYLIDYTITIPERIIVKKAKKLIAVSEGLKRELMEEYNIPKNKVCVIQNGVDLEKFKPNEEERKKIREKYSILEEELILMFSGAAEFERKGLRYIIESLPYLKNVKLMVLGKGKQEPYKKLAKRKNVLNKIIFTGFVPSIVEYYCAADVFVFPSFYEAFSLATLEAVASGLPLITTKINGTEELVKEGYNGFFVKRDPKDIAEKINILIKDENLRKQMSKNARKTAENYSWDKCAKRTAEVYEELLKK